MRSNHPERAEASRARRCQCSNFPGLRQDVAPQAEGKLLHIDISVPATLPLALDDLDRIRRILINLNCNAVKFSEQGSVSIGGSTAEDASRSQSATRTLASNPRSTARFRGVPPAKPRLSDATAVPA